MKPIEISNKVVKSWTDNIIKYHWNEARQCLLVIDYSEDRFALLRFFEIGGKIEASRDIDYLPSDKFIQKLFDCLTTI